MTKIKGWRKIKETKNVIIFRKQNVFPSYGLLDDVLIGRIDKSRYPKEKNNWAVYPQRGSSRLFKTKSQALKYARNYMRKH